MTTIERWGWRLPFVLIAAALLAAASCAPTQPSPATTAGPSRASTEALLQIRHEIETTYAGRFYEIGDGDGVVGVGLLPTEAAAADELLARYGSAVDLSIGLLPYPAPSGLGNVCRPWFGPFVNPASLRVTIEMPGKEIERHGSGYTRGSFDATVRITNTSDSPVGVETGQPATIFLFGSDPEVPVGAGGGGVGTGRSFLLEPGQSATIPADGATWSCDLALGYELPDGPYLARAVVERGPNNLLSEPFPVTIVTQP